MAKSFRCRIVTPADAAFEGEVAYVSFPAWDGQQGVMAGQSPLLTRLGIGPLRLDRADGGSERFFIDGGFAQVQPEELTILTERALRPEEIAGDEAAALLKDANQRAVSSGGKQEEAERDQQRARAMQAVAGSA